MPTAPLLRPARRFPSFAALAALAALAACMPGPVRPPAAPVRGQIAPGALAVSAPAGAAGPLRVAFATPRGETTQATEISIVFSEPMRPLGLGPHEPPPPVTMSPEVPGRWQWVGSSALRFNAAAPFPSATPFRVEVPAGARALDGDTLAEPYVLEFSTPRPALTGSEPEAGAAGVAPGKGITLWLSQPVAPEELTRTTSIRAGGGAPLPFSVEPADDGSYRLAPKNPLPLAAEIKVRIDASLRGREGSLPMGKDAEITFRTPGPFAVASWSCATPHPFEAGACDSGDTALVLKLSNPAMQDDISAALVSDPPLELSVSPTDYGDEGSAEYRIDGPFETAHAYRLRLKARPAGKPLKDIHGQALPADAGTELRIGDDHPAIHIGATGTYWKASKSRSFPVHTLNVASASLTAAPLTRNDALAWLADPKRALPALLAGDREPRFDAALGPRNEGAWSDTSLDHLLQQPGARGPVMLRARWSAPELKEPGEERRLFQITDLGAVTRAGHDGAAVWITRLSDGAPVAGATVEAYQVRRDAHSTLGGSAGTSPAAPPNPPPAAPVASTTADARGFAWLPLRPPTAAPPDPLAILVRSGDDWIFQEIVPERRRPVGDLFDERGIYRPGERVQLKGIVRVPGAHSLAIPRGREVEVKVYAQGREEVGTFKVPLTAHGTFAIEVPLKEDAPLGRYSSKVLLDGLEAAWNWFQVEEYRPAEAKIEASVDRPAHRRGDTLRCGIAGSYLYGAPMTGASVTAEVTRGLGWHSIPGLEKFTISDDERANQGGTLTSARATLDGRGAFGLSVPISLPGQTSTESVTCSFEVLDRNRQAYGDQASVTVHPADYYVALERDTWSLHPGDVLTQRVLVVTPEGARRSRPVHVEMIRREDAGTGTRKDTPVVSCDLTPGLEPAACKLAAPKVKPGENDRILIRASVQDERGDTAVASYSMSFEEPPPPPKPAPPSPRPRPQPPSPPPPPRLELKLDREELRVGDVARIEIRSPFQRPADALLTVEREDVLERRLVTLKPHQAGPTVVELPVTAAMIPNVGVQLTTIDGEETHRESAWMEVDPAPRRLEVALRPSCKRCGPGDLIELEVEAKDAGGRPAAGAEITLWGADEGSLELAGYRLPDPIPALYERRDVLVRGANVRDALVRTGRWGSHRTKAPQVRMGATSVSGRRGDFRQTVLFEPSLRADASGRVRHRVRLPDGLTSYRFFAVVISGEDRFGAVEAKLTTSKPLMARPSLPRVIRAGDELEASVVLSTQDLPRVRAAVSARAEGLTPLGPPRRSVDLEPATPQELRFGFRAERPGRARLSVDASAPMDKAPPATDAVDLTRPVVLPIAMETAAVSGDTAAAIAERLGDLADVRPDFGGLDVALSTTPLSGLAPGIEQLLEYPYGCTEQTVSRMVPLLALRDLARSLGVVLPEGELGEPGAPKRPTGALAASLSDAVARVAANQRPDGGYGYWPGSGASDPWLTAYARWGLGEAKRRGVPVPEPALEKAMRYLEGILVNVVPDRDATDDELAIAALIVDLLAVEGDPDALRAGALFEQRARLPLSARALLLHALAAGRGDAAQIAELTREIEAAMRIDGPLARLAMGDVSGSAAYLDSDARTTAMALRALSVAAPAHRLLAPLARGLLADRRGGRWRTTQEAAWALVGLDAYRRAHPPPVAPVTARVFLGDALLREAELGAPDPARVYGFGVPMRQLFESAGAPLVFAAEGGGDGKGGAKGGGSGEGRLFYEATLRYARRTLPAAPVEAGFFVQKTFRAIGAPGGTPGQAAHESPSFRAGDVVLCEIEVVTPSPRRGVVLEDPLPGGLEPVNLGLRGGGSWLAGVEETPATRRELRDDRVVYFVDEMGAGIRRFRYVARAITPGSFVAPPTRVEEMYAPETFGATAAGRVRVERP